MGELSGEEEDQPIRDLRKEAKSLQHLMTHMPKNKYCRACQRAEMQEKPCRQQSGLGPPPTYFGEHITVDHIVAHSEEAQGVTGDLDALAVYDRGAKYCECFPLWSKGADDAYAALIEFLGPRGKAHYFLHGR